MSRPYLPTVVARSGRQYRVIGGILHVDTEDTAGGEPLAVSYPVPGTHGRTRALVSVSTEAELYREVRAAERRLRAVGGDR